MTARRLAQSTSSLWRAMTLVAPALLLASGLLFATGPTGDEFARKATWKAPSVDEVRGLAMAWLKQRGADEAVLRRAEAIWSAGDSKTELKPPGGALLERLADTFALGRPEARELVERCSQPRQEVQLPPLDWLSEEKTTALERNNSKLLYGRWLAQQRMYDEALEQLDNLKAEDVVDPAGLLFYQGVVQHRLLAKEAGLAALTRLLEREGEIPRRYQSLAHLMMADLAALKDDSLDHIARRMEDVERRLDLGRAGPKVREVEDGVIKSLDKLIEEMEKQQQAAAAAAAAGGQGQGNNRPSSPAPDSMRMAGKGPGNVTRKNIGNKSGWGDLPSKQREQALQQIGKEFPAHYRDVVEQYFRKLANEEAENK